MNGEEEAKSSSPTTNIDGQMDVTYIYRRYTIWTHSDLKSFPHGCTNSHAITDGRMDIFMFVFGLAYIQKEM